MVSLSLTTSPVSTIRSRLRSNSTSTREPNTPTTPTSPTSISPTFPNLRTYATTTQRASHIERLPSCIVQEIGRRADTKSLLHLSLCSHRLSKLFAPALYHTVSLKTNRHCKSGLLTLSRKPHLSQHIRALAIHVNALEWTERGDEVDEDLVAGLVAKMAERRGLKGLEAFEWDGMEMPVDSLWMALKNSCRHLKRIATSVGEDALNPASPLWDFNDLRAFSLTVKCHSLDWLSNGLPRTEKLPRRCWEMLLERSPRLEELKIAGPAPSPRVFDIRHITSGRWSRLRSLVLGDMVMISNSKGEEQTRKDHAAFQSFFIAHPKLQHIVLQHAGGSPHFPQSFALPASALPNVRSFGGPLKYVKTLPFPQRLRELRLTSLYHTASAFPPTYALLQELRWLESLSIWIDLSFGRDSLALGGETSAAAGIGIGAAANANGRPDGYDDVHMLQSLVMCRPGLKHLEVSCFTRPTFAIRDFSTVIQAAGPSLRSFVLTKVYKSNEEEITKAAARLVNENPSLGRFTIRMTHDSWLSPGGGRIKSLGVYDVLGARGVVDVDENGMEFPATRPATQAFLVNEWGQKNITGKEYSKHYVHSVSPLPHKSGSFSPTSHSPRSSVAVSPGGPLVGTGMMAGSPFPPSSWQTASKSKGKHQKRPSSSSGMSSASAPPVAGGVNDTGSAPVSRAGSLKWTTGYGYASSSGASTPSSVRSNSLSLGPGSLMRRLSWRLTGGGKGRDRRASSSNTDLTAPVPPLSALRDGSPAQMQGYAEPGTILGEGLVASPRSSVSSVHSTLAFGHASSSPGHGTEGAEPNRRHTVSSATSPPVDSAVIDAAWGGGGGNRSRIAARRHMHMVNSATSPSSPSPSSGQVTFAPSGHYIGQRQDERRRGESRRHIGCCC
ncbi:hypothetical protein CPC08DRAFT_305554 [Agrocybe pediades]|nr:hypothetical protein CPC08DRAFT_305554 [Agrocybe pediades]